MLSDVTSLLIEFFFSTDSHLSKIHLNDKAYSSVVSVIHPAKGKLCLGVLVGETLVLVDTVCVLFIKPNQGVFAWIGIHNFVQNHCQHFTGEAPRYENSNFAITTVSSNIIIMSPVLSYLIPLRKISISFSNMITIS